MKDLTPTLSMKWRGRRVVTKNVARYIYGEGLGIKGFSGENFSFLNFNFVDSLKIILF
jgi:hypothetical protein